MSQITFQCGATAVLYMTFKIPVGAVTLYKCNKNKHHAVFSTGALNKLCVSQYLEVVKALRGKC